jgi:hypothetical protein
MLPDRTGARLTPRRKLACSWLRWRAGHLRAVMPQPEGSLACTPLAATVSRWGWLVPIVSGRFVCAVVGYRFRWVEGLELR